MIEAGAVFQLRTPFQETKQPVAVFAENLLNVACFEASQLNCCAYYADMHCKHLQNIHSGSDRSPPPGAALLQ